MKAFSLNSLKRNPTQFLLLAIGSFLIGVHLTLAWRSEDINLFCTSVLFCVSVSSFIGEKHPSLNLDSRIFPTVLGILVIALFSLRIVTIIPSINNIWLYSFPFFSALGLALLASGFSGLKQYRKELLILFFLLLPRLFILLLPPIDISLLTAKFSTLILWYTGFQVIRSGVNISFPEVGKGIEVYPGCAGIEQIIQLLGIAILFITIFPLHKHKKILVPILASILAFIVNGVRVALMAILVAGGDNNSFEYWHTGEGSQLFPVISVLLFGCFCWFFFLRNEQENQDSTHV